MAHTPQQKISEHQIALLQRRESRIQRRIKNHQFDKQTGGAFSLDRTLAIQELEEDLAIVQSLIAFEEERLHKLRVAELKAKGG